MLLGRNASNKEFLCGCNRYATIFMQKNRKEKPVLKRIWIMLMFVPVIAGIILTAFTKDILSAVIVGIMVLVLLGAVVMGQMPIISYAFGFTEGLNNINKALDHGNNAWAFLFQQEKTFEEKTLDAIFDVYKEKITAQKQNGQILNDIEDYINEDKLYTASWQNLIRLVPGIMTSLGILGTFIGLIVGIRGIGFTTVEAALQSIEDLLSGIDTAFYTSIAGVILSILFNITHRLSLGLMNREMSVFVDAFHEGIIPPVDEQERYAEKRDIKKVISLLDRIPQNLESIILDAADGGGVQMSVEEQVLMPQIMDGMEKGEFRPEYKEIVNLEDKSVIGRYAVPAWQHPKLGALHEDVFQNILEKNGYIRKLMLQVWDKVFDEAQAEIKKGKNVSPISVRITKSMLFSGDIAKDLNAIVQKHEIPTRLVNVGIPAHLYQTAERAVLGLEGELAKLGYGAFIYGFSGDIGEISRIGKTYASAITFDASVLSNAENTAVLEETFRKLMDMGYELIPENINSMEEVSALQAYGIKSGCGAAVK